MGSKLRRLNYFLLRKLFLFISNQLLAIKVNILEISGFDTICREPLGRAIGLLNDGRIKTGKQQNNQS